YTFPAHREDLSVLRVVCRNGFSSDLAALLIEEAGVSSLLPRPGRSSGPPAKGRSG
ncbi:glutamate decarboxylase, partial [Streptomyces microflavus]